MPRYVALLRGINLGNRRLAMSKLAAIFEGLGYADVATFIASGNVIFRTNKRAAAALEREASERLERELGYEVEVFVRTAEELTAIAALDRFHEEEQAGASIHVGFMRHALDRETQAAFEAVRTSTDRFVVIGREFYWICGTKMSESTVWELPEAKRLRLPSCTLRKVTTVRKLVAKHFVKE